jgi:ribonucleoside-diphosphate reductase beta chain
VSDTTIERSSAARYTSPVGINRNLLPWRLWSKAKKLFWDPADIDYSQDIEDWKTLPEEGRIGIAVGARGFMVGEEAVTLDILPLVQAISDEGRLEETIYLTSFALEEAKHVDFFRTWFDAVGFDPSTLPAFTYGDGQTSYQTGGGQDIFGGELQRVMGRLNNDRSPEAFLDAAITYNQFIEGVAAIAGYKGWSKFFEVYPSMPGLQEGLRLIQRDERRHIAYGTYLCRRLLAANPELWGFVERRWEELTKPFMEFRRSQPGAGRGRFTQALIDRRLEVMRSAVGRSVEQIESGSLEELEATSDLPAPAA